MATQAINNCQIINWIIMKLAIYMKLWRVKHENTAWHTALQESDEFEVPGWEDLKGTDCGVLTCGGAFTSLKRLVSISRGRGWSHF